MGTSQGYTNDSSRVAFLGKDPEEWAAICSLKPMDDILLFSSDIP